MKRTSTPIRSPIYAPETFVSNNRNSYELETLETSFGGNITGRGNSTGRLGLTRKPSAQSIQKLGTGSYIKRNSLATPSADSSTIRIRDMRNSHLFLNGASSPLISDLNFRSNITTSNAHGHKNINSFETEANEPAGGLFKNSFIKGAEYIQPTFEKRRNKSIGITPSQLDLSSVRTDAPVTTNTKRSGASQAYTKAMKALQDKIRQLEDKLKDNESFIEQQKVSFDHGAESSAEKHQMEINELARSERAQREKAEMFERQNMELNLKIKNLEEEKANMFQEFKEVLHAKSQIESKYQKLTLEKAHFHDAYEDIGGRVERMQKELDAALQNECDAQERLQQNVIETNKEREILRSKNFALTDALRNLEKDYNECKNMYGARFDELTFKNETLEKEIEQLKADYSQQMNDFDQELIEIDKSHAVKVADYERTIAELKQKISELEKLNTAPSRDLTSRPSNNMLSNRPSSTQHTRPTAVSQQYKEPKVIQNIDVNRRLDVSGRKSYSDLSPVNVQKENGFIRSDSMPRIHLKINSDARNFGIEDNIDSSRILSSRNRNSPDKTNRSHYSTVTNDKPVTQSNLTKRSQSGYLNIMDLTNKENLSTPYKTNILQTPAPRATDEDFETYLSPDNNSRPPSTSANKRRSQQTDPFQAFGTLLKGSELIPRESANFQKNLSFGNPEPLRETYREPKIDLRNSTLKDASNLLIRKHREDLMSSVKDSTKNLNNHASLVIEEKVSSKEKELKRLNDEYQDLMKRTQESEDSKERSMLRAQLIKLTEDIQKINESIYQLRKQGSGI